MTAPNFQFDVQSILLPKADSQPSECEDSIGIRGSVQRYCIADGATEAFDSRRWARLLTKHWVRSDRSLLLVEQLQPWLCSLSEKFCAHWSKRQLPWFAEEKARGGAFAAFCGLSFLPSTEGLSWQAIAIGDSCLIKSSGSEHSSFPISDPESFGFHPILIPSDVARQGAALDHVVMKYGRVQGGDVFLLLTDAIAAWYLRTLNKNPRLAASFDSLLGANDQLGLEILINGCRSNRTLRNDDVAAIRIAVSHPAGDRRQ